MCTNLCTFVTVAVMVFTAQGARAQCCGDCNGNRAVTINEIVRAVNAALSGCAEEPRYVDNGDGTVTDNQTALMWEKKDTRGGVHDANRTFSWTATPLTNQPDGTVFTRFLAALNNGISDDHTTISGCFAGHCDWRLPTIVELETILLAPYPCQPSPCIDPIFGPMAPPDSQNPYWSATTDAGHPEYAWFVTFSSAFAGHSDGYNKAVSEVFARAVRGGL